MRAGVPVNFHTDRPWLSDVDATGRENTSCHVRLMRRLLRLCRLRLA
jgi:hypothetical protein